MREWKHWIMTSWLNKPKALYRWIKDIDHGTVSLLQRPDGTLTGRIAEMDCKLHGAWDPIMRRYADAPEPDVVEFMHTYSDLIPNTPMTGSKIDASSLRVRVLRTSVDVATGTDGWSAANLRQPPTSILAILADLLNLIEDTGRWPKALIMSSSP